MQQMLIGIILVLGLGSYYFYNQNQVLSANNLASRNAQIEQEMNSYLDIFRRHNLNQLAIAKPGMIEKRINDGTAQVFESIENDSKELDSLDDPSSDINPNN